MREIWGCMVRKATFECHRKRAERSFISALSCHLRASREHSTVTDGTLNFRSGGRIRNMLRREIFIARKGNGCSTISLIYDLEEYSSDDASVEGNRGDC